MKYLILILSMLLFISCSEDGDKYYNEGNYTKALEVFKTQLKDDYKNAGLRRKIAYIYFDMAEKDLNAGSIKSVKRNIDRAFIYGSMEDSEVKKRYNELLVKLGKTYIDNAMAEKDSEVLKEKLLKKGEGYINKAMKSGVIGEEGKKILSSINQERARTRFENAVKSFDRWKRNTGSNSLLINSRTMFEEALESGYNKKESENYLDIIHEKMLTRSETSNNFYFRIMKPQFFHDKTTGLTAFKVRLYNNMGAGYRQIAPEQFVLTDRRGRKYKAYTEEDFPAGYRGPFKKRRMGGKTSYEGLLVFKTGRRNIKFSNLKWESDLGESFVKKFPNKDVRKIDLTN